MEDHKINARGFWETEDRSGHFHDEKLMQGLLKFCKTYKQKFIVDLGCGPGDYVRGFRKAGYTCDGYDGNPNTAEITGGLCSVMDLSEPQDFGIMYDMVLSLEVGEHIPEEFEGIYLDNLVAYAANMLVISWAVPNQAGLGHVNCRENGYIIGKLKERGFRYDDRWSGILRRSSRLPWFKKTLMVFHREKGEG